MRALNDKFFKEFLSGGKYSGLVERVHYDKDLDLEFRGNYINIYYQGHSILKLGQSGAIEIDKAFTENGCNKLPKKIPDITNYLKLVPFIKDNVSCHSHENDAGERISKKNRELD